MLVVQFFSSAPDNLTFTETLPLRSCRAVATGGPLQSMALTLAQLYTVTCSGFAAGNAALLRKTNCRFSKARRSEGF
jgi:hypothetical protein